MDAESADPEVCERLLTVALRTELDVQLPQLCGGWGGVDGGCRPPLWTEVEASDVAEAVLIHEGAVAVSSHTDV